MNTTAHDFVTVDMRGLKAALVARAQAQRVSVSELVRSAVARDLGLLVVNGETQSEEVPQGAEHTAYVKLSIRMTAEEAAQLAAGARAAGLSRGCRRLDVAHARDSSRRRRLRGAGPQLRRAGDQGFAIRYSKVS